MDAGGSTGTSPPPLPSNAIRSTFFDKNSYDICIVVSLTKCYGCTSDVTSLVCGVSPGSFIGPLLFIMYFHEACTFLQNLKVTYGDEAVVFVSGSFLGNVEGKLNHDLQRSIEKPGSMKMNYL